MQGLAVAQSRRTHLFEERKRQFLENSLPEGLRGTPSPREVDLRRSLRGIGTYRDFTGYMHTSTESILLTAKILLSELHKFDDLHVLGAAANALKYGLDFFPASFSPALVPLGISMFRNYRFPENEQAQMHARGVLHNASLLVHGVKLDIICALKFAAVKGLIFHPEVYADLEDVHNSAAKPYADSAFEVLNLIKRQEPMAAAAE